MMIIVKLVMDNKNRINRLSFILYRLSVDYGLSTPNLVDICRVSKKTIQTDFKEYILPLFNNDEVVYDYSLKVYTAKTNFLATTLFTPKELAVIAIAKAKSKDKYSDKNLHEELDTIFKNHEELLHDKLYEQSSVEKIDNKKAEIKQIKYAIPRKHIITCTYNNKKREIYPLKILNIEAYWYLIVFEKIDNKIKTYHLNSIKDVEVLKARHKYDIEKITLFDNAINAYFKVDATPICVQLYINTKVVKFFMRKPLNASQRVMKTYKDGSIDLEAIISTEMEIIPVIQKYLPHVKIISPTSLKDKVHKNIMEYLD